MGGVKNFRSGKSGGILKLVKVKCQKSAKFYTLDSLTAYKTGYSQYRMGLVSLVNWSASNF